MMQRGKGSPAPYLPGSEDRDGARSKGSPAPYKSELWVSSTGPER